MRHARGPGSASQAAKASSRLRNRVSSPSRRSQRLGQVHRLRVAAQRVDDVLRHLRDVEGRRLLQLEDRDAGVDERLRARP